MGRIRVGRLVGDLYGLTEEEIKIVDPALHEATQGKGAAYEAGIQIRI